MPFFHGAVSAVQEEPFYVSVLPGTPSEIVPHLNEVSITKKQQVLVKKKKATSRQPHPSSQVRAKQNESPMKRKTPDSTVLDGGLDDLSPSREQNLGLESRGQAAAQMKLTYAQALNVFISRNKKYPRRARRLKQAGTVNVRFHIDQSGQFHHVHLEKGCNHRVLNQEAVALIKKLGRFKPLPKSLGSGQDFVVPIQYRLMGGS